MSDTKFCPNCGAKVEEEGIKFCSVCGASLTDEAAPVPSAAQPGEQPLQQPLQQQPLQQQPLQQQPLQQPAPAQQQQPYMGQQPGYRPRPTGPASDKTLDQIKWKYFNYEGRLNRLAYFLRVLVVLVVGLLVMGAAFVVAFVGLSSNNSGANILGGLMALIGCVAFIPLLVSCIMLVIQRCHDLDKTGWFFLLGYVPFVGIFFALYILFAPGTYGPNRYGPDPLEGQH